MTRQTALLALVAALVVPIAGCGGDNGGSEGAQSTATPTPTATPLPTEQSELRQLGVADSSDGKPFRIIVNHVETDGRGLGAVYWTLENTGSKESGPISSMFSDAFNNPGVIGGTQAYLVHLVDEHEQERRLSLNDEVRTCLCNWIGPGEDFFSVEGGESVTLFNMFVLSPEATTVGFEAPGFKPLKGLPVTKAGEPASAR